ncbi:MAG TPA: hypothetical protein VG204_15355 [Terriglobia bacterium]|nr:hypothetical protein [Terriglobia bacterium]
MKGMAEKSKTACFTRFAVAIAGLGVLAILASTRMMWPGTARASGAADTASPSASASTGLSLAAAQSLEDKLRVLQTPVPPATRSLRPVTITEAEANSYLKYRSGQFLPPAVHDPELHIASDSVSGTADVDFGQLNQGTTPANQANDWTTRALAGLFTGKQRVAATGKLATGDGQGRVTIESVSIGGINVPPALVDWLLQNYVAKRYKVDLSKPFALPDHVTRIELAQGRALFVRSPDKGR